MNDVYHHSDDDVLQQPRRSSAVFTREDGDRCDCLARRWIKPSENAGNRLDRSFNFKSRVLVYQHVYGTGFKQLPAIVGQFMGNEQDVIQPAIGPQGIDHRPRARALVIDASDFRPLPQSTPNETARPVAPLPAFMHRDDTAIRIALLQDSPEPGVAFLLPDHGQEPGNDNHISTVPPEQSPHQLSGQPPRAIIVRADIDRARATDIGRQGHNRLTCGNETAQHLRQPFVMGNANDERIMGRPDLTYLPDDFRRA
ncbi:hypothetical protein C9E81_16835 [Paracoccus alkanivorans]|uniref:Uncharacterized protein n=1 Tax=Paracoccus alkanivorans TaxID=2116655 RepID=A0A3M0M5Z5_9RHOB|nr:hypothetical protein C9E81_16835 [Paracoccus alkanivorans]